MTGHRGEISFRPWTAEDVPALTALANDPAIGVNLRDGFPYPYTENDAREFIELCLGMDRPCNYAITYQGSPVGGIGYVPGTNVHRISAEIGYWLAKDYWNNGIATAAVKAFSEFIFATTEIVHLHAGIFSTNPASGRVLEKAGYRYMGSMHRCAVKNGRVIGLDHYELCKPGDGIRH